MSPGDRPEYVLARQRRLRARRAAAGLRREDGAPLTGRRVVSWARGPLHLPRPGTDPRRCHGCGGRIRPYLTGTGSRSWRHAR